METHCKKKIIIKPATNSVFPFCLLPLKEKNGKNFFPGIRTERKGGITKKSIWKKVLHTH